MRVIGVDDERPALQGLLDILREAVPEAEVKGYRRSAQALEDARLQPADVAFLDIEMGGMNGLELAKALKDIRGETDIVFVTGYSQYALDAFSLYASGYLLKPVTVSDIRRAMEHLRYPARQERQGLRIQTFGNFEVFRNGVPLHFPRSKSKEMFAYLIHKRGTGCTTRELAAVLFEDRPYTLNLQKQVQTLFSVMRKTMKEAGAGDYILRSYNYAAVNVSNIQNCDYYRFLNWDVEAVNEYMGEYMSSYSWAEFVIGYLDGRLNVSTV